MRSGAQFVGPWFFFVILAFGIAGLYTSMFGAAISAFVVFAIVLRVCNAIDRREIEQEEKGQKPHGDS